MIVSSCICSAMYHIIDDVDNGDFECLDLVLSSGCDGCRKYCAEAGGERKNRKKCELHGDEFAR